MTEGGRDPGRRNDRNKKRDQVFILAGLGRGGGERGLMLLPNGDVKLLTLLGRHLCVGAVNEAEGRGVDALGAKDVLQRLNRPLGIAEVGEQAGRNKIEELHCVLLCLLRRADLQVV